MMYVSVGRILHENGQITPRMEQTCCHWVQLGGNPAARGARPQRGATQKKRGHAQHRQQYFSHVPDRGMPTLCALFSAEQRSEAPHFLLGIKREVPCKVIHVKRVLLSPVRMFVP